MQAPEYFDVSSIKMPDGTFALKTFSSNVNKHIYELSLQLFNQCNLNCTFCFENPQRKCHVQQYDPEYILSIPQKVEKYVSEQLRQLGTRVLYIRIWGGELFQDTLPKSCFDVYDQLCKTLEDMFHSKFPDLDVVVNFMTNGIWDQCFDDIVALARKHPKSSVGFSYDIVGRYSNDSQKKLAQKNIMRMLDAIGYVNVAITATKPNIDAMLAEEDEFISKMSPRIAVEINSYIPNFDWKVNLPSEQDIFKMYCYLCDHSMFMVNSITTYVQSVLGLAKTHTTVCDCRASVQFADGKLVTDCVRKSSSLPLSDFYGDKEVTDENCHAVKHFCAASKRHCLECEHYSECPGFCTTSVLFKEYRETACPLKLFFKYIQQNRDAVLKKFLDYSSKHVLPCDMDTQRCSSQSVSV